MLKKEIKALFPKSKISTFDPWWSECLEYASINTKERLGMFLAQVAVESGFFTTLSENLKYSAERLAVVWPNRFKDKLTGKPNALAKSVANKPELIAREVYGSKLGNTKGNAYFYKGRGLIQLTGYANYKAFNEDLGSYLGVNFLEHPDALLEPRNALYSACHFWKERNINVCADKKDVRCATKLVNGGFNALRERQNIYDKIMKVI